MLAAQSYQERIPGTETVFDLNYVEGGTFLMGSPADESGRSENEGPQVSIEVSSFWLGQTEVTYEMYAHFQLRELDNDSSQQEVFQADAVTRPSPPYQDYTLGMGTIGNFPAVSMTQQAALRYCYWLYQKTGHFYRLPTEAEWEYACRAGTQTPFSFPGQSLDQYAWYWENSGEVYHPVGQKKPNAWGFYDLNGNVMEWTLDEYKADYFARREKGEKNPHEPTQSRYGRTVKGGAYDDDPEGCRCANRLEASPSWQARDPQVPKSEWWNPDSPFVGFRLLRPAQDFSPEEIEAFFKRVIRYE